MSLQNILAKLDKVKRISPNAYKALCPVHGEKTPSLSIKDLGDKVIAHCFGCGATGVEVVESLGLEIGELFRENRRMDNNNQTNRISEDEKARQENRKFLDGVSVATKKLTSNDPATKYLNKRGIIKIPPTIRYLPEYKQGGKYHPCLIARLDNAQGERVSYKIIHLTEDGQKAEVEIVKKTLPCERDMAGAAVKLFPVAETLAVCEGVETALAHHQKTGIATWGLDNAENMKKFQCPASVKHLIIIPDMDKNYTGQAAAYTLANKAALLIGKQGYQLETVVVSLIMRFQEDFEVLNDHGVKVDYLDYLNQ